MNHSYQQRHKSSADNSPNYFDRSIWQWGAIFSHCRWFCVNDSSSGIRKIVLTHNLVAFRHNHRNGNGQRIPGRRCRHRVVCCLGDCGTAGVVEPLEQLRCTFGTRIEFVWTVSCCSGVWLPRCSVIWQLCVRLAYTGNNDNNSSNVPCFVVLYY
jgi:hypothetical protein